MESYSMYSEKKNKVLSLSFKYPEGHSHCSMYVSESFLLHVLISTLLNAHRYPPSPLWVVLWGVKFPPLLYIHLSCHFLFDLFVPCCAEGAQSVLNSSSRFISVCKYRFNVKVAEGEFNLFLLFNPPKNSFY